MGFFVALAGVQLGLLCVLGLNTSLVRGKCKAPGHFDPTDSKYKTLYAAQRAHGNQSEWGPAFAVMFLACHVVQAPAWVQLVAAWATAGRFAISYSLALTDSLNKPDIVRKFGGASTYFAGFILSAYLICSAL
jgi:uncharacterized membrane protein YecN with MAPEG domain